MAEETKQVEETNVEQPKLDNEVGKLKMNKKKNKYSNNPDVTTKIDLTKSPIKNEEANKEVSEEEVIVVNPEPEVKSEEVAKETEEEDLPVVEEITMEDLTEEKEEEVEEVLAEAEQTGKPLSEQLQKVADFMKETGGTLGDYVKLNRDLSKMDDSEILDEYYRETKSHLSNEERDFMLEENFGYDEEDDPKEIQRKKIALKEQVAEAKAHLDRQKSKYYEEINVGSSLSEEQQKAINFFNRYNKESKNREKVSKANKEVFLKKTDDVFNKDFKGFDFNIGEKKFRFNVKNADEVKAKQSDINNFVNKFVDEDKITIKDAAGYHKSLFTAMNADAVARHFYEQGRADAIKGQVAKDKNIDMEPRKMHGETNVGGVKYRVLGDSARDFKFKINKK